MSSESSTDRTGDLILHDSEEPASATPSQWADFLAPFHYSERQTPRASDDMNIRIVIGGDVN